MRFPNPDDVIRRIRPSTYLYLLVAFAASSPAWITKYPPIQDLPFHLATIRVIHSFGDAAYGLKDVFELTLGRTQYVFYYVLASLLSYVTGIKGANVLLMSAYLGGTPLAIRALLRALRKDERACLLSIPLLVNVMFMFGLLPFLLGIPLMFWGLAVAVEYFEAPTRNRAILLGALAFALFYSHIFPFGIFGLGFAAMFPWRRSWKGIFLAGAPTIPALSALAYWTLFTKAGNLVSGALIPGPGDNVEPVDRALPGFFEWLTNVWRDQSDDVVFVGFFLTLVVTAGLAQGDPDRPRPVTRAYTLLPVACVVLYLCLGQGHDYIWLISQRFPILFLLTAIPLFRMPSGLRGWVATGCALLVGAASIVNTDRHFVAFRNEEVGDIDGALAQMDPAKKVCALIYDKGSQLENPLFVPFMHFGSYYQYEKGGVVEFTYAGYAHWPFTFKEGKFPPPGGPARKRWEWTPEQVRIGEIFPYYDYVLTRGDGFRPPPNTYRVKSRTEEPLGIPGEPHRVVWTVWEKAQP